MKSISLKNRFTIFLVLICFLYSISSCNTSRQIETTLYFGQTKPSGEAITEAEWKAFTENYIARFYGSGCTIISAMGKWLDPETKKLITEPSYIVIRVHENSALVSRQIDSLRNYYITMFQQQSVLRTDKRIKFSF